MTTSLGLTTSSPYYLNYTIGATGVFSLGLGLTALINPLLFLKAFNIQAPTPETRKVARDLLIVFAARDLALGFAITSAAYYGHREIMGWSMVGVGVIAFLDGLVSRGNERGAEFKHWAWIGISGALALVCFGYV